jgi:hypothetical protein
MRASDTCISSLDVDRTRVSQWSSLPGMEPEEGVVVTVVSDEPEAEVVCGLLRTAGIDCAYRDTEAIDSSLEEFIAAGPREILVRESDLDAARELLAGSPG